MPFKLGSGLLSDYDFSIEKAWFSTSADYNDGQSMLLFLEGTATDSDGDTHPDHQERYSVGADWSTTDGGKTVISDKGAKFITKTSMYGRFIAAAQDCVSETIDSKGMDILERRSDKPGTEAAIWVGLSFHLSEVEFDFGKGKNKLDPTTRNMPTSYLGAVDGSGGKGKAGSSTGSSKPASTIPVSADANTSTSSADRAKAAIAAAKAKAASSADSTPSPSPVESGVRLQLATMATESGSWEVFVEKAFELTEVSEDDTLQAEVTDDSEMGFYATHH